MLDISDFNVVDKPLENISATKREDILGISLHCYANWYDLTAQYGGYTRVKEKNDETIDYGFNYSFDEYDTVNMIDNNNIADPFQKKKMTYIAINKFNNNVPKDVLSICIFIDTSHDYEITEKRLIKFLAFLLNKYKLETKDIWRSFDLSKEDIGPLHYLDKEIFEKFLDQVQQYYDYEYNSNNEDDEDNEYKYISPFSDKLNGQTVDEYIKSFYNQYKNNPEEYSKNFEPWDKNDQDAINNTNNDNTTSNIKTYKTKNSIQYTTKNNACNLEHCSRAFDSFDGTTSTQKTFCEPIYPDLITPPGSSITLADGNSSAAITTNSDTPITIEDFEKRQKKFDLNDFQNIKKQTKGRPINTDEPYPVDEQISKLQEHYPKVKIDNIKYNFDDDNHPGSQIGPAALKNFNMIYDIINEISKRTEKRLVKIENILSTVTRNLFRVSSRMNINCVYYGGQSIYNGKYKCIRCLKDNRIDDGAIVSLDQCLCCTRYEPILGQVYAILDEAGSNVSQIVDDIQMSYNDIEQYNINNNINQYNDPMTNADLTKDSYKIPKRFRDTIWADTDGEIYDKRIKREQIAISNSEVSAANDEFDTFSKNGVVTTEENQISSDKKNNVLNNRNEKITITFDEFKDYLDQKLQNVVILDRHDIEMTKEEYLIANKYDFLSQIIPQLENANQDTQYKDSNGNTISRDDYIEDVKKRFRESYVDDIYYNGFKMDWTPTLLEIQQPNINEYSVEKLQNGNSANENDISTRRNGFEDTRKDADKYEKLEFDINDYVIAGFGSSSSSGSSKSHSNLKGADVRKKILEYAKSACDLCAEGKAWYSMNERLSHDGKVGSSGKEYWDCSSLAGWSYQKAGLTSISEGDTTYTEYPQCKSGAGGMIIDINDESNAIPGDLIFFSHSPGSDIENVVVDTIHHVAIYAGDGKMYEAASSSSGIHESPIAGRDAFCFGRPYDLVEADKSAASAATANGYTEDLVAFTKSWEGFVSSWDKSSAYGAIGYGTDASGDVGAKLKAEGRTSCTEEEADGWLRDELNNWANEIKKRTSDSELSQECFDCMLDICYQWGNQQWKILDKFKSGDIDGAKAIIINLGYARRDRARCDILDGNYTLND